jgi:hypothetical protein
MPGMRNGRRSPSIGSEKVVVVQAQPRTPAEYALHAVFTRFVTAAEMKIEAFVKHGQVRPFI